MKSLYGSEKKSKKDVEVGGRGMEEETKMEICLFSAVVSSALIFLIAYYFIYVNTQSKPWMIKKKIWHPSSQPSVKKRPENDISKNYSLFTKLWLLLKFTDTKHCNNVTIGKGPKAIDSGRLTVTQIHRCQAWWQHYNLQGTKARWQQPSDRSPCTHKERLLWQESHPLSWKNTHFESIVLVFSKFDNDFLKAVSSRGEADSL